MTKKIFQGLSIVAVMLCLTADAYAAFTLSVSPRRGGRDIRFEASDPGQLLRNEEVTVSVDSTLGTQYRITQTVYGPLIDSQGHTIPQDAFIVFSPSSPLGTLRTQMETPVQIGQSQIYTSNSAGESDSFVLVFNVRVPEGQPGGLYRTQITFIAEPATPQSGVTQEIVNLQAVVDIRPTFQMEIRDAKGSSTVDLGKISENRKNATATVNVKIESNIGTIYRITQRLAEPLVSAEGAALNEEDLVFALSNSGQTAALSEAATVIYTSSESGESESFQIQLAVNSKVPAKAGIYNGTLEYKAESASPLVSTDVIRLPIRLEVSSILYLDMKFEDGGESIYFGTLKTKEDTRLKKVILEAYCNTGKPYQISQIFSRKLTNADGSTIDSNYLTFQVEAPETGSSKYSSQTVVPEGETVIYASDPRGTPERILVNYALQIPLNTRGGKYTSDVRYSIALT